MLKNILIIGSGSIAKRHKSILKKIKNNLNIVNISSRVFDQLSKKKIKLLSSKDFDYILICSPSNYHFKHLKEIEKNFEKKIVLIEKPIFNKKQNLPKKLKNRYFVGYNLRFNPVIQFLKKYLKKKNIYNINVNSYSYLPIWRKNKKYFNAVSAKKKLGGGVALELSHEIDYLLWFFKDIRILTSFNAKISLLKINTDDVLNFISRAKKIIINVNMNFFSLIKRREIIIDGKDFSLKGDLLSNKVIIKSKEGFKEIIKSFNNQKNDTYIKQHMAIFNGKFSNLCTLEEGIKVLNFLKQIKKAKVLKKGRLL